MFAFTWLFGFTFWLVYIIFGLIFCVIFIRKFAPKTYKVITDHEDVKKEKSGHIYINYDRVNLIDIFGILVVSLLLWPIAAVCIIIWMCFYIFSKTLIKLLFTTIKATAKRVPEINIETNKE